MAISKISRLTKDLTAETNKVAASKVADALASNIMTHMAGRFLGPKTTKTSGDKTTYSFMVDVETKHGWTEVGPAELVVDSGSVKVSFNKPSSPWKKFSQSMKYKDDEAPKKVVADFMKGPAKKINEYIKAGEALRTKKQK